MDRSVHALSILTYQRRLFIQHCIHEIDYPWMQFSSFCKFVIYCALPLYVERQRSRYLNDALRAIDSCVAKRISSKQNFMSSVLIVSPLTNIFAEKTKWSTTWLVQRLFYESSLDMDFNVKKMFQFSYYLTAIK